MLLLLQNNMRNYFITERVTLEILDFHSQLAINIFWIFVVMGR